MPKFQPSNFNFQSDYMEGAHPLILQRLAETNLEKTAGYGSDPYSIQAKERICEACECPQAEVQFLVGGTQTNATVISALLRPCQGVISADTGHIALHEAGAIERGGHKVLTIPHSQGKISAADIDSYIADFYADANHSHMVMPGMVYISQPTEFGTLYSLEELKKISAVCRAEQIPLYLDGARLAYALSCPENDVTLPDLAAACDAFYIGGTKCGALFGEAVVIPEHNRIPHLFTMIKQHGALLAKGRIAGLQFDTLFTGDLYDRIGSTAIEAADRIRRALEEKGYTFAFRSPTNQIFILLEKTKARALAEKVELGFWENADDTHVVMRIATSWATRPEDVDYLIECL
jgi:threonine aldolase